MAGISYKALVQLALLLQIKKNALSYVCEEEISCRILASLIAFPMLQGESL